MTTINQALLSAIQKISKTSKTPQLDAEVLLSYTLNTSREHILTYPEKILKKIHLTKFYKLIASRRKHLPIAYLIGRKEFYGINFKVDKNTLIPRPETELLVDLATRNIKYTDHKNKNKTTIIDIGTGSGNIIISIAKELEKNHKLEDNECNLFAIDISQKALTIAKHNAKENNVNEKIKFIKSDLLSCFFSKSYLPANEADKSETNELIIIANLPYLSKKIYSSAMPDVKKFEPKSALLSGIDGLYHYEKLFQQIKQLRDINYSPANKAGKLQVIIEISPEQKDKINKLILKYFPKTLIDFRKDLSGKWRVAIAKII